MEKIRVEMSDRWFFWFRQNHPDIEEVESHGFTRVAFATTRDRWLDVLFELAHKSGKGSELRSIGAVSGRISTAIKFGSEDSADFRRRCKEAGCHG